MLFKQFDLTEKTAVVIGGGRGIGKAIALTLAEAGGDIVVAARSNQEIRQTVEEIERLGRKGIAVCADATKAEDLTNVISTAISEWEKIDILVNSAGVGIRKPIVSPAEYKPAWAEEKGVLFSPASEEDWGTTLNTNVTSIFLATRAVGPHMIRQRKGKIINISSFMASKSFAYQALYSTSKAAVNMYTRALALEWARYNINVNAIAPGYVHTQMTSIYFDDDAVREKIVKSIPLGRLCQPREVALLAVYLASEASDYITGQTIYIDGGLLA
ncbi:MAG: SDR family oxidoreductase [Candidatus Omnitrophica bacterium]|nr:SDR family oxidoreductase [Candidatus Omnitrophota bacterium]